MISTSILYCNKLDALPLTNDYKTSDSTCSNSLTNSVNTSGGRFRVRYLGCNACDLKLHRLKDGISVFQKSLLDLYTTTRRRSIALRNFYPFALNQVIDVCSYGVVVAERDPTIIRLNRNEGETVITKVITPLSNILLWAAVRFNSRVSGKRRVFGAAFVPLSCSDAVLNKNSFIPLSSKQRFLVGLPHPPLFVCVLQKVSNPRELECHLFVCSSAEDAISLCALLGDTQKHFSKIGSLQLPLPGQMGNYSFKSPSRMSRSTTDCHNRSVTIDTQSDSSRVGGKSVSNSSYKSRFTPTSQLKHNYKFRPQQQQLKDSQQYKRDQQIQKQPFTRKCQIDCIHTKNLPQNSSPENKSKTSLQSRDYRSHSYRFSDNTQTPTATPTTSSSSDRHHYHNHCNPDQRYQSRNSTKKGFLRKRDVKKVYCNCNNDKNISIINNDRGMKHMQKNEKYVSNYNNSNIIAKNIRDEREVTSVEYKSGTSSDSGEPKLGTKGNITIKSGNIMCHKDSINYKYNNGHNPIRKEIMNSRVIAEKSNVRNYVTSDESNYNVKNEAKIRETKRNSVHRKHRNQDINGDSSVESSSISEIIVKDNVKRVKDNKQLLCSIKVNTSKVVNVPNVVKSTIPPNRRYFGDTIRCAKSSQVLNNSSDSITSYDDKKCEPKLFVKVRNATTSCRDAPWITNKNKHSMTVSETIFLGSESDSKKSSSMSHISNDSITKRDRTKSSPNLICTDDELDRTHASGGGVELIRKAQLHSNYKLTKMNNRFQSSRSGSPFARNNRVAIYLPEMKCVKSFNSRSDVKQWSTLSLSSNVEANISTDKSAPNSRPDLSYETALPVVEHQTFAVNVPLFTRFNPSEYKNRDRSSLISRLRRMSLRSWVSARRGTTRFLSKFKSKRKRRKRYSNPSTDSAIDLETNVFRPEKQIYLVNEQNRDNLRRQHSWSFHDFTLKHPMHNKDKNLRHCSSSPIPSPSLSQQNIANVRILDNKSSPENRLHRNNAYMSSNKIVVRKGTEALSVNHSNNLNGEIRPQNSMSSDSGMEEIDCFSSTDVTNSINSQRRPVTVSHNKVIGNNYKNEWSQSESKSAEQQVNRITNKRKPFRHWSQTNLEEELGYMP